MKIKSLFLYPYSISLVNGALRQGVVIHIVDEQGNQGWGDIAPLPKWSRESLEESLTELNQKQDAMIQIHWEAETLFRDLIGLNLLPSVSFGLESALLSILDPLPQFVVKVSAFFSGSVKEILEKAKLRHQEGFRSAKLKVGHLPFLEASHVIHALKGQFDLRIDVNRAWETEDSLRFFEQFPSDTFDYVEEPFKNPHDLRHFTHPLAIDESFPGDLSLVELESLKTLKAVVYKPTIQGGMAGCMALCNWTRKQGISLVLSSSFESDLGHAHVACMAHRLQLGFVHFCTPPAGRDPLMRNFNSREGLFKPIPGIKIAPEGIPIQQEGYKNVQSRVQLSSPLGIGTYHDLKDHICRVAPEFSGSTLSISPEVMAIKHFSKCSVRSG